MLNAEDKYILKMCLQSGKFKSDSTGQELESFYNQIFSRLIQSKADGSVAHAPDQHLPTVGEAQSWEHKLFAGCIAPPTKVCTVCGGNLQKHNKPSCVTYFLASGPLPFLKVELRCRACNLNYGISKFGNTKDGFKYYDRAGIIEASDVVYIDRLVMDLFTSLRYELIYIV